MLVVAGAVPAAAGLVLAGESGARVAGSGALFGLLLAIRAGWRLAARLLPVLVVFSVVAAATSGAPAWIAVLALLGAGTGVAARYGLSSPIALVGAAAASAPPLALGDGWAERAVWVAVAALYAVAVARLLHVPPAVRATRVTARTAGAAAIVLGAVVALAATLAVDSGSRLAYWLPATVFLLAIPVPGLRWTRAARSRVLGTAVGVAAGALVTWLEPPGAVRTVVVVLTATAILALPRPTWLNAALLTVTLMLVLDPTGSGVAVGEERLEATVVAAALFVAGATLLGWVVRRAAPPVDGQVLAGGAALLGEQADETSDVGRPRGT